MVVPPEGVARGFASLMSAYNAQRIGAATVALGIAQGAYEHAIDHAKGRFFIRSNWDAENFRVLSATLETAGDK